MQEDPSRRMDQRREAEDRDGGEERRGAANSEVRVYQVKEQAWGMR